MTMTKSVT